MSFIKRFFHKTLIILQKKSYDELFAKHPFLKELQFTEKYVIFPNGKLVELGSPYEMDKTDIGTREAIIRHHIYEKSKCRDIYKQIRKVPVTIESRDVIILKPDFTVNSIEKQTFILDGLPCTDMAHWIIEEVV